MDSKYQTFFRNAQYREFSPQNFYGVSLYFQEVDDKIEAIVYNSFRPVLLTSLPVKIYLVPLDEYHGLFKFNCDKVVLNFHAINVIQLKHDIKKYGLPKILY